MLCRELKQSDVMDWLGGCLRLAKKASPKRWNLIWNIRSWFWGVIGRWGAFKTEHVQITKRSFVLLFKKKCIMKYFKENILSQISLYIFCIFQYILHIGFGDMIFLNWNLHLTSWNLFLYLLYFCHYDDCSDKDCVIGTHLQLTDFFS